MDTLLLRAALKRGAVIVTANWPVILIDFAVESLYKLALTLPILGGALMVTTLVGTDLRGVLGQGMGSTADLVVGSLASAPLALGAFLLSLALVAVGGEAMMFIVKAGTLAVIVESDRISGDVHRMPFGVDALRRAAVYRLETVLRAARHFAGRAMVLALWLGGAYVLTGTAYVALVTYGLLGSPGPTWIISWSLLVVIATSASLVVITLANLAYALLRVIIVTDDCELRVAVRRLMRFVVEDARQVIGIFSVIGGVELVAGAVSVLAAAGLAPIAYMPIVSLVIVPLQAAVWMVRGLFFEALSLSSLAAYQTQYRRFSEQRWPVVTASPPEA